MINSETENIYNDSLQDFNWIKGIWEIVSEQYVRFDEVSIDWENSLKIIQDQFKSNPNLNIYDLVDSLLFQLKDPHTKLVRSQDYNKYIMPINICSIKNDYYVIGYYGEFEEALMGAKLLEFNNVSINDIHEFFFKKTGYSSHSLIRSEVINHMMFSSELEVIKFKFEKNNVIFDISINNIKYSEYIQNIENVKSLTMYATHSLLKSSNIQYFQAYSFMEKNICERFANERKQSGSKDYLIIDTRYNSGGLINIAKKFTSMFIETDIFLGFEKSKNDVTVIGTPINLIPSRERMIDYYKKIIILCNEMTSSSAEFIFLRALKNHSSKICIVGEVTAGMPHVATVFTLKNNFKLLVTTKKYLSIDGKSLDEKGIEPDLHVENSVEWLLYGIDLQLQTAISITK